MRLRSLCLPHFRARGPPRHRPPRPNARQCLCRQARAQPRRHQRPDVPRSRCLQARSLLPRHLPLDALPFLYREASFSVPLTLTLSQRERGIWRVTIPGWVSCRPTCQARIILVRYLSPQLPRLHRTFLPLLAFQRLPRAARRQRAVSWISIPLASGKTPPSDRNPRNPAAQLC